MVKTELIQRIADLHPDLPAATAHALVDTFFEVMSDQMIKRGRIEIRGFGAFFVQPPREGPKRDPRNGEPLSPSTMPRIRFRASSALVKAIASG